MSLGVFVATHYGPVGVDADELRGSMGTFVGRRALYNRRSAEGLNPRQRSDGQSQRQPIARHGMFKSGALVIWIALFAVVLSSVIRSEKIGAAGNSVAQLHHIGKSQQN
jgi:hypothetical protein